MLALRSAVAALSLTIVSSVSASLQAEVAGLPLAGRYVVVGLRAASDVATTAAQREADTSKTLIGSELRIGDRVSWYRERCEVRAGPPENRAAMVERNPADLQIAPASTDGRLNRNLIIDCLGRAIGDIWHVLVVDQRILVARSSPLATYLVLEQPLAPGDVLLLKQRLKKAGFDPGTLDERMNEPTRAAIAAYARKKGSPALLMPGVVTVNLLNALAEDSR